MIKVVCLLTMFIGFSYFGIAIGRDYSKKEMFLSEVLSFLNILSNDIKFNKSKLTNVINQNVENFKTDLQKVLNGFLKNEKVEVPFLTKYENQKMFEFLNSVGKYDVEGELSNIERYKQIFDAFYKESIEKNKKYGVLYSKLGVMLGLIVVIIFI